MSEKVFVAHVTLSWGEKRDYLIANDVEPGLQHRLDTYGNSWNEVMQNALMNVPVAPYLPSNSVQPPIATVKVSDVEARDFGPTEEKLQRTRSQFIMAAMWEKQSAETTANFLHHDYDQASQAEIFADVDYWVNGTKHPDVWAHTQQLIADQEKRLSEETAN